ncbi:MAG: hypothetical protein AB1555_19945 [Nitrospirota bacterium]
MLLFFMAGIKSLVERGRSYPFPRPRVCLKEECQSSRIWSHGYVDAYFDGYAGALSLKRYICADCGCVYTVRPFGYWPRHQVAVTVIFNRLCHRIRHGRWGDSPLSRQRQGHWLRALKRNVLFHLGLHFAGDLLEGFHELLRQGIQPVKRTG